jgi:hypothetical protein
MPHVGYMSSALLFHTRVCTCVLCKPVVQSALLHHGGAGWLLYHCSNHFAVCFHVVQVTWFVSWCLPRTCNTIPQRAVVIAGGVLAWWRAGMGQCKDVMAASAAGVWQTSARGQRRTINTQVAVTLHLVAMPHGAHTKGMQ